MYSPQSPRERQSELYQLAQSQGGYFTTKQAAALGFTSNKRVYHVRVGNWLREHRGIYKLARFPEPERSDLTSGGSGRVTGATGQLGSSVTKRRSASTISPT